VIASRPRVEAPDFAADRSSEDDRPGQRCFAGKHPACVPDRRRRHSRGWLACGRPAHLAPDLGPRRRSDRAGRLAGRGAAGARTVEHAFAGLPSQSRHRVRDRHGAADRARRRADDGEPFVRQLPRDARPGCGTGGSRGRIRAGNRWRSERDQPVRERATPASLPHADDLPGERPSLAGMAGLPRPVRQRDQPGVRDLAQRTRLDGVLDGPGAAIHVRPRDQVPDRRPLVLQRARPDGPESPLPAPPRSG
jgi:hypothetical protein